MRLLADCGNSTIKLALAHEGGIWVQQRVEPRPEALDLFLAPHRDAIRELAVLPGARAAAELVQGWWNDFGPGKRLRILGRELPVPELGQYPTCGLDRIMAGLAGCAQERKSLIIIDAGTATTFSAWRYAAASTPIAAIRFAGGLILPGAQACIAGLAAAAPALPAVEALDGNASACQRDTVGAIGAAVGIGYGPMVAACLVKLERETGIKDLLATGGNTRLIIADVVPRRAYRPSLVLEGLEMVCRLTDGVS